MKNTEILNFLISVISRISSLVGSLYDYRDIYKLTGLFATRKFKAAKRQHKYAILIAARNEETVIGNLIESIRMQDYPAELVDIFVVADNCSDRTAEIACREGAICYERSDTERRTKGYALQYLVECIRADFGIDAYEGYFIFDADNLLKYDYISRMNEAFDAGEKIITSYRNTKNFDDNWISASYGVHWLRTVRNEHRARSLFRLATRIQGTGFLFSSELIKNGWNYTSLTEDRAFCADAVAAGYKISYNHAAEFYDEQPVDIRVAMRQRIRWAKGHLQAFAETGGKLFLHIFVTGGAANRNENSKGKELSFARRIYNNVRLRFMSFDMLTVVYPRSLVLAFKKVVVYALRAATVIFFGNSFGVGLAPAFVHRVFDLLGFVPASDTTVQALVWLTAYTFAWSLNTYTNNVITAAYVYIVEHKRITSIKWYKKVWFCLTFPLFDLIGKLSMVIALFARVEWKPIPHKANIRISHLSEKDKKKVGNPR